jgi:hypothetical protein
MIIRSQDKTRLMPFDNSNGVNIFGNEVHICGDNYGEYSTREKAIKVLDMIQSDYVCHKDGIWYFQMPQDSEV